MPRVCFRIMFFYLLDITTIFVIQLFNNLGKPLFPFRFLAVPVTTRALLMTNIYETPPFHKLQILCSELSRIEGGFGEMGCLFHLDKETGFNLKR